MKCSNENGEVRSCSSQVFDLLFPAAVNAAKRIREMAGVLFLSAFMPSRNL